MYLFVVFTNRPRRLLTFGLFLPLAIFAKIFVILGAVVGAPFFVVLIFCGLSGRFNCRVILGGDTLALLKDESPMGRFGTAEEVASLMLFLADERSDFITGQVIGIDGGFI